MYGVSALVTVAVFGTGALSLYNLHSYVGAMSDTEVSHSLAAFEHSFATPRSQSAAADPNVGGNGRSLKDFTGQAPGTLIAMVRGRAVVDSAVFSDGGAEGAPASAAAAIESQDWEDISPRTIELGELGKYRAVSRDVGNGERLVSAISLKSADLLVAKKTVSVVVITLTAAVLAALGTVALLRWALRPLRRVAATAARAAKTPLTNDDHRITARVRHADSDPDHEVGIVGETLNRLLANIDSALSARAASDRRMRRFLTDASHELRTPLTAIRGYAELTRQESASLPPMTEYALARIESESCRMTTLVDDMLLLSRLDEGQGLEISRIELNSLVADAVNDAAVSGPDHRWPLELPAVSLWVSGDKARLHQVLSNLLANAHHHTPAGVIVTTALRTVPSDTGPQIEITVADDGPGIDHEVLPELFGRFVRGDRARSTAANSTGLGLAIVASIIEAHGGTVSARSGGGCTEFRILLPAADRNIESDQR